MVSRSQCVRLNLASALISVQLSVVTRCIGDAKGALGIFWVSNQISSGIKAGVDPGSQLARISITLQKLKSERKATPHSKVSQGVSKRDREEASLRKQGEYFKLTMRLTSAAGPVISALPVATEKHLIPWQGWSLYRKLLESLVKITGVRYM